MVKYTRLWETMQRKGISQYRLIKTYGISNGQLNRLRKNLYISTHTVETLCRILDCRVEDVMEIVFDENEEPLWSPDWKRSGRRRKNWKGKRTDRAERILMGGNLRLEDPTAWIKAMDFVRTEFSGCEKTRKIGC